MAQVVRDSQLDPWIDDYLDYLLRKWTVIPQLAAEWDDWDPDSQFSFVLDWGVPADRLEQVQRWAEQGLLTPAQRSRYDQLLKIVARNRSLLDRMLAD